MQSTKDITLHDDGEFIWEITAFLRVATGLTAALSRLHKQGAIHKNIKPGNILVKTASGEVWLTGFGISSRLARKRQSALQRGAPFELELRARRKDGAYRWLESGRPRQQRNLAWR